MRKDLEAAANALGGPDPKKEKPSAKNLREIHVRKGEKSGYIAKHHHRHPQTGEPLHPHNMEPEYPLANKAELMQHMQEHMGEESAEIAKGSQGEEGAPIEGQQV